MKNDPLLKNLNLPVPVGLEIDNRNEMIVELNKKGWNDEEILDHMKKEGWSITLPLIRSFRRRNKIPTNRRLGRLSHPEKLYKLVRNLKDSGYSIKQSVGIIHEIGHDVTESWIKRVRSSRGDKLLNRLSS